MEKKHFAAVWEQQGPGLIRGPPTSRSKEQSRKGKRKNASSIGLINTVSRVSVGAYRASMPI